MERCLDNAFEFTTFCQDICAYYNIYYYYYYFQHGGCREVVIEFWTCTKRPELQQVQSSLFQFHLCLCRKCIILQLHLMITFNALMTLSVFSELLFIAFLVYYICAVMFKILW